MTDIFERRIRERAYFLWEQAGRPEGKAQEHWSVAARYELRIKGRAQEIGRRKGQPIKVFVNFLEAAEISLREEDQMVRERAHVIWEEEGHPEGRHERNWFRAKHWLGVEGKLRKG